MTMFLNLVEASILMTVLTWFYSRLEAVLGLLLLTPLLGLTLIFVVLRRMSMSTTIHLTYL